MEEVGKWPGGLKEETTLGGKQETEERKTSERGSQHVEQPPCEDIIHRACILWTEWAATVLNEGTTFFLPTFTALTLYEKTSFNGSIVSFYHRDTKFSKAWGLPRSHLGESTQGCDPCSMQALSILS